MGHKMQSMDYETYFNERYFPRRTQEEEALLALADNYNDPYRFGPIAIDQITAQDHADIEVLKEDKGYIARCIRTYVEKRTLMAKAGRQRHNNTFMDCNEMDRDDDLIRCCFGAALRREDFALAQDLLQHGANPNECVELSVGWDGSPIFEIRTVPMLELLVSHGALLDKRNYFSDTPLVHYAVANRSPEFLQRLLQYPGVNVNANLNASTRHYLHDLPAGYRRDNNDTPLHIWAKVATPLERWFPSLQKQLMILIRAGANVSLKNSDNQTALDILRTNIADPKYCEAVPEVKQRLAILATQLAAVMPPQPQVEIAKKAVVTQGQSSCVICQSELEQSDYRIALSCAHVFHTRCINSWTAVKKNCPVCRTAV